MQRPTSVYLCMAFFGFSLVSDFKALVQGVAGRSGGIEIYRAAGIVGVMLGLAALSLVLDAATLYFLFKPRPAGYWTGIGVVVIGVVAATLSADAMLRYPDLMWKAFEKQAAASGVPMSPAVQQMMTGPLIPGLTLGVSVLIAAVGLGLLVWSRAWFRATSPSA